MTYRINRREAEIDLGDEYAGASIRCRFDVPTEIFFGFLSTDADRAESIRGAIKLFCEEVLISWDIEDDDGAKLPATEAGMMRLPQPLVLRIIEAWSEASAGVPKEPSGPSLNGNTLAAAFVETEPK